MTSAGVYDRFNIHAQQEHLQRKYDGTGHADTTKWQWGTFIARDALASHVGHFSRLVYLSAADNTSISRLRFESLRKMIQPCGPPPPQEDPPEEERENNAEQPQQPQQHPPHPPQ